MPAGSGAVEGVARLRIAYLSDRYPQLTITAVWREVAALRSQGVDIEPFALWPPARAEALAGDAASRTSYLAGSPVPAVLGAHAALLAGSPVRYARALLLALGTGRPGGRGLGRRLACFTWAALLVRHLRARGLRHLHNDGTDTSCTVAMLAAALGGIRFSFTVHGPRVFFMVQPRDLATKLRRALFVRCISDFTRSQCLLWLAPDRWDRLHVIHCGIDPDAYPMRVHRGRGTHLLFVGHPGIRKGVPFLVEAVAPLSEEHPDLRLTIVGDGPERGAMEALVRTAGIAHRVQFTGYQTAEQVAEWLSKADAFVLPSVAEGVPVVLMEAMAAGVPVVATNVGGTSELVVDGVNGFLVAPGVPDALARRAGQLLADPELRTRLGRAGRATVIRDFDVRREALRLRELFVAAAGGPTTETDRNAR